MWNFVTSMGHPGQMQGPYMNQKRNFSFHVQSVPIVAGKTFSNPNFVNKHHPSVHSYQNNFILTPIQKISHVDGTNVDNTKSSHTNSALVNSSQSIVNTVKGTQIDIIQPAKSNITNVDQEMCHSRKRNKRDRRSGQNKFPGKSSKQNITRQQLNDMMDVDLELELSNSVSDISMSPKAPTTFNLTDFIVEKPTKSKTMKEEKIQNDSGETETVAPTLVMSSVDLGRLCVRERQVSITESEDSFIVFDSGTDEELEFSEESETESEEEEDMDSSSSVIPHKRVSTTFFEF